MKVNFGCGKHTWDGWFCIDAAQHPKASRPLDLVYAAAFDSAGELLAPVPLPDDFASELHSHHFIEHIFAWEAPAMLREWHRLLRPGGMLVIECPNLLLAARNLLAGDTEQMSMWPIYGDWGHRDPLMMHKHGYTPDKLAALVRSFDFVDISHRLPQTHGARANRDMRLEARKLA